MGPSLKFRTTFAKALTGAAVVITAVTLVYTAIEDGAAALWQAAPFILFGLALIWVLFGHPKVAIDDDGVTMVNIIRSVHVPWPRLREVQTRWSLTLETDDGDHTSWAIPASSALGSRMRSSRSADQQPQAATNLSGNSADAVAQVISERFQAVQEAAPSGSEAPVSQTTRTWNIRELIVLAAGTTLLVGTALLG